ncbi:MAG: EamA family transporter RarD, partial [Pseudomonadota bacterium]
MTPAIRLGFFSALGAYTIWGLLPLYFKALGHIAPEEMLAHRILWSVPTGIVFIAIASKWA